MNKTNLEIMGKLIGHVKPLSLYMIIAILMGVAGNLSASFITITGVAALLKVMGFRLSFSLNTLLIILILLGVVRGVFRYIEQTCNHYIAFKLLAIIRDKVFASLRKLCPAKLDGSDKGNLISIITEDIELLEVFYAHTISPTAIGILFTLIMTGFLWSMSPVCGAAALIAYCTVGAVMPLLNARTVKTAGLAYRNGTGSYNSALLNSLYGLEDLIQFDYIDKRRDELNALTSHMALQQEKIKLSEARNTSRTNLTVVLFVFIIFLIAYTQYSQNIIGFSEVILITIAVFSSFGPVIALNNLSVGLSQTMASAERVLSILEEKPAVEDNLEGEELDFDSAQLSHVTFGYDMPIIKDLSLSIKKKDIIGIYGKSGCGKSTLIKLLMRFWDINGGHISLNGENIKNIKTSSLRDNESYCTQDTFLFNDTIGNNIKVAKLSATQEEVIQAAKKAALHDFIQSLPLGYDTQVGALGDKLSGGEKQRVGTARAFLSDAPLMLLDEPTSNLDSLNEGIILKSLEEVPEKTVVLISHKKSTLTIASETYEMAGGTILNTKSAEQKLTS